MSDHRIAFLKAVEESPMDETTRQVYADWLDEQGDIEEANRQRQYVRSRKWLTSYAIRLKPYDAEGVYDFEIESKSAEWCYEQMMNELSRGEIYAHGTDLHGLHELDDADEFFKHVAIVLGKPVSPHTLEYNCSC